MKRVIFWLLVAAIVFGAVRLFRERLIPLPEGPIAEPPRFRVAPPPPPPAAPIADAAAADDDLTEINGIGPVYAERLAGAGVVSFEQLAGQSAPDLAERIDVREDQAANWISQAAAIRDAG